ncbi:MAG: ATP-binding protein [Inquilinaceae bacterium]
MSQSAAKIPLNASRLLSRLKNRQDSEHEQAIIRIFIMGAVVVYFKLFMILGGPGSEPKGGHLVALAYFVIAIGITGHIIWRPERCLWRRIVGMLGDFAVTALVLGLEGEHGAPFYLMFLWVSLGNGFRYGLSALRLSIVVSSVFFAAAIMMSDYWRSQPELSIGMWLAVVLIPVYASTLIKKLTEAKIQAERANESKSRFLANMSHELRTPLNAVIGLGDLLQKTKLADDQYDMVYTIRRSGRRLLAMIEEVLDLTRIEAGRLQLENDDFDLHMELADLIAMLRPQAEGKGIALSVHVAPDVPFALHGDWHHLGQAVFNLSANAIKFTERGHVQVVVDMTDAPDLGNQVVRFRVIDTGIGVASEHLERIFDTFTQADESVNRRYGGTGLGLAIVRQLAELMGGQIAVESEEGVGSRFSLIVPLASAEGEARERFAAAAAAAGGRVVVVTGDSGLHPPIQNALDPMNVKLTFATDATQAREMLMGIRGRGVVLVDGRDPAVDPVALCDELRSPEVGKRASFIMLEGGGAGTGAPPPAPPLQFLSGVQVPVDGGMLRSAVRAGFAFGPRRLEEEGEESQDSQACPSGGGQRILVAEDNAVNRMVIGKILERAGYAPVIVANGDEALDILDNDDIAMAILDINMPGTSGLDVAKLYRMAHMSGPRLPIIALSADTTESMRALSKDAGIDLYLTKPIEPDPLVRAIQSLLTPVETVDVPEVELEEDVEDESITRIESHPRFRKSNEHEVIDRRVLQDLQALDPGSDFVTEVVEEYLRDAEILLPQLQASVDANDLNAFRDLVHALRSASANVGARQLYEHCCGVNSVNRDDFEQRAAGEVDQIAHEFSRYRRAIGRYLTARDQTSRSS